MNSKTLEKVISAVKSLTLIDIYSNDINNIFNSIESRSGAVLSAELKDEIANVLSFERGYLIDDKTWCIDNTEIRVPHVVYGLGTVAQLARLDAIGTKSDGLGNEWVVHTPDFIKLIQVPSNYLSEPELAYFQVLHEVIESIKVNLGMPDVYHDLCNLISEYLCTEENGDN